MPPACSLSHRTAGAHLLGTTQLRQANRQPAYRRTARLQADNRRQPDLARTGDFDQRRLAGHRRKAKITPRTRSGQQEQVGNTGKVADGPPQSASISSWRALASS